MKLIRPRPADVFTISPTPAWPRVVFETDTHGPHEWAWTITWGAFKRSGAASTPNNQWDAQGVIANLGGTLTVRASAGTESVIVSVSIKGMDPIAAEVTRYLSQHADSAGFDKIVAHESKFRHFNHNGEPIKSFDDGFGLCQLTTPPPSFEQVWNWQRNLDAGLALFAEKRAAARAYLGQSQRSFTDLQLKYEAVCRWNGGTYHVWDATAGKWVRPAHILCDTATGNIGWDIRDPANAGQTAARLRARDAGSYAGGPHAGTHWKYFGVCYADQLLQGAGE